jgi:adenylylsulfate kinase-like enzyme
LPVEEDPIKPARKEEEKGEPDDKGTLLSSLKALEEASIVQGRKKQVLVIIPFGVVGSGKSTFAKSLKGIAEQLNWTMASVSSDATRKELMDDYIKKNKGASRSDAY